MPKTRQQKQTIVEELTKKFQTMKGLAFTKFFGLTMSDLDSFRAEGRKTGVEYIVAKKSLLKVALEKAGLKDINPRIYEGEIAVAVSQEDEVAPAKSVAVFAKKREQMRLVAGILEGKLIGEAEVKALAALPSKRELLARVVGSINAPVSGFVNVLAGNLRGLVNVLNALKDKKV